MKFRILWTRKPRGLTVFVTTIRAKSVADARKKFVNSKEGETANLKGLNVIEVIKGSCALETRKIVYSPLVKKPRETTRERNRTPSVGRGPFSRRL